MKLLPFKEARDYARSLYFGNRMQWILYTENISDETLFDVFPYYSDLYHKVWPEWNGWNDFLIEPGRSETRSHVKYSKYLNESAIYYFLDQIGVKTKKEFRLLKKNRVFFNIIGSKFEFNPDSSIKRTPFPIMELMRVEPTAYPMLLEGDMAYTHNILNPVDSIIFNRFNPNFISIR